MSFIVGQRWVSQAENDLGLGTILQADNRFVQVLFPAADETRNYAADQAPLMRVEFAPGDKLNSLEEYEFIVENVEQSHGTLIYHGTRIDNGEAVAVKEIMLDHHISLNTPEARLLTANYDRPNWFSLRLRAHQQKAELESSALLGLQGARVGLIPHQLYIANSVGQRFAPRVLLADEVGLGKTIEAGLIIHQQLLSGRSQRVLIILPESLQHQWLVEMLRRFNLHFSIFDEQRINAEAEGSSEQDSDDPNYQPFDSEQQVIVSQEWLSKSDKWQQKLLVANWDLVVVDEAHHITPDQEQDSEQSHLYQAVQTIGAQTQGLILLTATPDQLGHYGHFCRLQLLDPARFHSYDVFKQEETKYQQVADIANTLLEQSELNAEQSALLTELLADSDDLKKIESYQSNPEADVAEHLIKELLDRHGTGRIMFRNSRHGIKGFPERKLLAEPLALPEGYPSCSEFAGVTPEVQHNASPTESDAWWKLDPRVNWLIDFLKQNKSEKVLIICAHASTAMKLDDVLFESEGLRSTVFHEGMTIVERDKAAAYFADEENSAQALTCSEIGSEGRNFQFAHHLVLFDLPANPDLLEQRIGRLDRIGQTETVKIHVPYLTNTAQENLFNWYQQSFDAFEHTSTTARIVATEHKQQVADLLLAESNSDDINSFIEQCQKRNSELKQEVENGRDRLLELNSSGGSKATDIQQEIEQLDDSTDLMNYMIEVWDQFGVQHEEKATFSKIIRPGDHMLHAHFPLLQEDGMTVCFDRETALSQEDQHFLTWEHPMVTGTLDMLSSGDLGNSSVCLLPHKQLPAGTFLIEASYLLSTNAPKKLQLHRHLPNTAIRMMLDKKGNNLADKVKQGSLDKNLKNAKKQIAQQLVKALKDEISPILEKGQAMAEAHGSQLKAEAKKAMLESGQQELTRIKALQQVNPAIRDEEIEHLAQRISDSEKEIDAAKVSLDAIRLIVVTQA